MRRAYLDANATLYGIQRGLRVKYNLYGTLDEPHEELLDYYNDQQAVPPTPDSALEELFGNIPGKADVYGANILDDHRTPPQAANAPSIADPANAPSVAEITLLNDGTLNRPNEASASSGPLRPNTIPKDASSTPGVPDKSKSDLQLKLEKFYASLPPGVRGEITDEDADVTWSYDTLGYRMAVDRFGDKMLKTVAGFKRRIADKPDCEWHPAGDSKREQLYQEGLVRIQGILQDRATHGSSKTPVDQASIDENPTSSTAPNVSVSAAVFFPTYADIENPQAAATRTAKLPVTKIRDKMFLNQFDVLPPRIVATPTEHIGNSEKTK